MSRSILKAPLAVASDGSVLLNLLECGAKVTLEDLLSVAKGQRGATFVGVVMHPAEVRMTLEEVGHGFREAAAYRGGKRLAKLRNKQILSPK